MEKTNTINKGREIHKKNFVQMPSKKETVWET